MYIHMKDGSPLGLARIWEERKEPDVTLLDTFAILTMNANKLLLTIPDRMPVILAQDEYALWFNRHLTDPEQFKPLYQPYPAELLEAYPVSNLINSPRNNSSE